MSYCQECANKDAEVQRLREQVRVLREALEKQNKWLSCQEGGDEYPSDDCKCDACGIQREVNAALGKGAAPMSSEYNTGYNAGIAAAMTLLLKAADQMKADPGMFAYNLAAESVRIGAENIRKLLR